MMLTRGDEVLMFCTEFSRQLDQIVAFRVHLHRSIAQSTISGYKEKKKKKKPNLRVWTGTETIES